MTRFPVSIEKENELLARMEKLGVREADIEETFVRSSGHGGQNVNKLATCVVLVHRPSGIQVRCQEERTQGINRFKARRMLTDKIEARMLGEKSRERQRIEKIRRQKRKRSRRAKEKMLADKRHRSTLKHTRRFIAQDDN